MQQYNICSLTNERNMHVYFLLSYHLLTQKWNSVTYISEVMKWLV